MLFVLVDAVLAWRMLRPGGVAIFDDYEWQATNPNPFERVAPALDFFQEQYAHEIDGGRCVAIQRGPLLCRRAAPFSLAE